MNHALQRPRPPLDQYVECLWAANAYVAHTPRERVLPSGSLALVIHLGESPLRVYADEQAPDPADVSGAILCGARQTPLLIDTSLGPTVGVQFKPGGARPFFEVPAMELIEQTLPLELLWGGSARSLREQLMEAPTAGERMRLLEAFLLRRLRASHLLSPALRISLEAFEEAELTSVAEVNHRTGLSPKRLLALFREEVGLSPKAYWRVRRFRAALHDLDRGSLRGAALACSHGYCDQAHFLREFRALAGSTPSEYLAARVSTDHVSVAG